MGATCSRSSPPTETLEVTIREYSKLMRAPENRHTLTQLDKIFFRDIRWDVKVWPMPREQINPDEADDIADKLIVGVWSHKPAPAVGTDISIEILDETGENTVFQSESSRGTWEEARGCLMLSVRRRELEASSCVRHQDDSLTVRFTLKEQPKRRRRLLSRSWPSSEFRKQQLPSVPEVAMAASHTLTVASLSKLKAALLSRECAYSTRFAVRGSRWYVTLYPTRAVVQLVRATKEDDQTRTTAEFSFALEGAVNVESGKMRHTFDRANPFCMFAYQPPDEASTSSTDSLVVRCYVTVIPADTILTAVSTPTESVLTPLLGAMHG